MESKYPHTPTSQRLSPPWSSQPPSLAPSGCMGMSVTHCESQHRTQCTREGLAHAALHCPDSQTRLRITIAQHTYPFLHLTLHCYPLDQHLWKQNQGLQETPKGFWRSRYSNLLWERLGSQMPNESPSAASPSQRNTHGRCTRDVFFPRILTWCTSSGTAGTCVFRGCVLGGGEGGQFFMNLTLQTFLLMNSVSYLRWDGNSSYHGPGTVLSAICIWQVCYNEEAKSFEYTTQVNRREIP